MKRLVISISLFTIICIGCISETLYLCKEITKLNQDVENILQKADNDNIESAIELNKEVYNKWQENQNVFSLFIDHSKLDQIDQEILRMQTNLIHEQTEDFYTEAEVVKAQLNSLREMELPIIQHIL